VPLWTSQIGHDLGLTVIGIKRGANVMLHPDRAITIRTGDRLLVLGREERVSQMNEWGVEISHATHIPESAIDLIEAIIPPRSGVVGKTLVGLDFRRKYALTVAALWRGGRSYRTDVGIMPLEVGDALLVLGTPPAITALAKDRDFLVLQSGHLRHPLQPGKAIWALVITALVLLISIIEIVTTAEAMMIGAAAMALTGCIHLDEAYRAIEWRVIFLIAGMLPISLAMVNTGLAARIGDTVVDGVAPAGPLALVAGFFVLTMLVTQLIGGQVAALVIGPIAVTSALDLGVNPQAVAVAVAVACSTAFLTPVAHPVNVLMMGPGGYQFGDFFKVGLGMTVVTFITLLIGMILFWGL
jgi:di/tricarboxylate transporter